MVDPEPPSDGFIIDGATTLRADRTVIVARGYEVNVYGGQDEEDDVIAYLTIGLVEDPPTSFRAPLTADDIIELQGALSVALWLGVGS